MFKIPRRFYELIQIWLEKTQDIDFIKENVENWERNNNLKLVNKSLSGTKLENI